MKYTKLKETREHFATLMGRYFEFIEFPGDCNVIHGAINAHLVGVKLACEQYITTDWIRTYKSHV